MTAPTPIKQIEVSRYAKAMQAAGIEEWRLEVRPTGERVLIVGKQDDLTGKNEWDR